MGPGTRQDLGLVLLEVLGKEQQGWDKAQLEKGSGLERQRRGGSGITGEQRLSLAEQVSRSSVSPSVHRAPAIPHRAVLTE